MSKRIKKRNSILKKPPSETPSASPTISFARTTRRISFSCQKSVKEFLPGQDSATVWLSSYEELAEDRSPEVKRKCQVAITDQNQTEVINVNNSNNTNDSITNNAIVLRNSKIVSRKIESRRLSRQQKKIKLPSIYDKENIISTACESNNLIQTNKNDDVITDEGIMDISTGNLITNTISNEKFIGIEERLQKSDQTTTTTNNNDKRFSLDMSITPISSPKTIAEEISNNNDKRITLKSQDLNLSTTFHDGNINHQNSIVSSSSFGKMQLYDDMSMMAKKCNLSYVFSPFVLKKKNLSTSDSQDFYTSFSLNYNEIEKIKAWKNGVQTNQICDDTLNVNSNFSRGDKTARRLFHTFENSLETPIYKFIADSSYDKNIIGTELSLLNHSNETIADNANLTTDNQTGLIYVEETTNAAAAAISAMNIDDDTKKNKRLSENMELSLIEYDNDCKTETDEQKKNKKKQNIFYFNDQLIGEISVIETKNDGNKIIWNVKDKNKRMTILPNNYIEIDQTEDTKNLINNLNQIMIDNCNIFNKNEIILNSKDYLMMNEDLMKNINSNLLEEYQDHLPPSIINRRDTIHTPVNIEEETLTKKHNFDENDLSLSIENKKNPQILPSVSNNRKMSICTPTNIQEESLLAEQLLENNEVSSFGKERRENFQEDKLVTNRRDTIHTPVNIEEETLTKEHNFDETLAIENKKNPQILPSVSNNRKMSICTPTNIQEDSLLAEQLLENNEVSSFGKERRENFQEDKLVTNRRGTIHLPMNIEETLIKDISFNDKDDSSSFIKNKENFKKFSLVSNRTDMVNAFVDIEKDQILDEENLQSVTEKKGETVVEINVNKKNINDLFESMTEEKIDNEIRSLMVKKRRTVYLNEDIEEDVDVYSAQKVVNSENNDERIDTISCRKGKENTENYEIKLQQQKIDKQNNLFLDWDKSKKIEFIDMDLDSTLTENDKQYDNFDNKLLSKKRDNRRTITHLPDLDFTCQTVFLQKSMKITEETKDNFKRVENEKVLVEKLNKTVSDRDRQMQILSSDLHSCTENKSVQMQTQKISNLNKTQKQNDYLELDKSEMNLCTTTAPSLYNDIDKQKKIVHNNLQESCSVNQELNSGIHNLNLLQSSNTNEMMMESPIRTYQESLIHKNSTGTLKKNRSSRLPVSITKNKINSSCKRSSNKLDIVNSESAGKSRRTIIFSPSDNNQMEETLKTITKLSHDSNIKNSKVKSFIYQQSQQQQQQQQQQQHKEKSKIQQNDVMDIDSPATIEINSKQNSSKKNISIPKIVVTDVEMQMQTEKNLKLERKTINFSKDNNLEISLELQSEDRNGNNEKNKSDLSIESSDNSSITTTKSKVYSVLRDVNTFEDILKIGLSPISIDGDDDDGNADIKNLSKQQISINTAATQSETNYEIIVEKNHKSDNGFHENQLTDSSIYANRTNITKSEDRSSENSTNSSNKMKATHSGAFNNSIESLCYLNMNKLSEKQIDQTKNLSIFVNSVCNDDSDDIEKTNIILVDSFQSIDGSFNPVTDFNIKQENKSLITENVYVVDSNSKNLEILQNLSSNQLRKNNFKSVDVQTSELISSSSLGFLCKKCKKCKQILDSIDGGNISDTTAGSMMSIMTSMKKLELNFSGYERFNDLSELINKNHYEMKRIKQLDIKLKTKNANKLEEQTTIYGPDIPSYDFLLSNYRQGTRLPKVYNFYMKPVFPLTPSFEFLLENKFESEKNLNWILNDLLYFLGIFEIHHKKIHTHRFVFKFSKESINLPKDKSIIFDDVLFLENNKNYSTTDILYKNELQFKISYGLKTYCQNSDELFKFLNYLDDLYDGIIELTKNFMRTVIKYNGKLQRNQNNELFVMKKIKINYPTNFLSSLSSSSGVIFESPKIVKYIMIKITRIEKISYNDIITPDINEFSDCIKLLPIGIDFINEFLCQPEKYFK